VDEVYEDLFKDMRLSAKNIIEIGVDNGGSIFMWREYFENAKVIGIDNKDCPQLFNRERIEFIKADAYDQQIVSQFQDDFDVIIDDGPHTLESMTFIIKEYINKTKENGVIVIEDIQDFNWTNILKRQVPENFEVEVRDLRRVRNRYDDILMIIRRKISGESAKRDVHNEDRADG
jgi:cyclopropane fatty-acyl-phospholipid synthase-like methyltransferase